MTSLRIWASKAAIIWTLAVMTHHGLRAIAKLIFILFLRDVRAIASLSGGRRPSA